jgi:hypothetical protein
MEYVHTGEVSAKTIRVGSMSKNVQDERTSEEISVLYWSAERKAERIVRIQSAMAQGL